MQPHANLMNLLKTLRSPLYTFVGGVSPYGRWANLHVPPSPTSQIFTCAVRPRSRLELARGTSPLPRMSAQARTHHGSEPAAQTFRTTLLPSTKARRQHRQRRYRMSSTETHEWSCGARLHANKRWHGTLIFSIYSWQPSFDSAP